MAFALEGVGADTASGEELKTALGSYVPNGRISFTGPHKPQHELALCVAHKVNAHLDSPEEVDHYIDLLRVMDGKACVTLRLRPKIQANSRFGMPEDELLSCAETLVREGIGSAGISFHLSGYEIADRISAGQEALAIIKPLNNMGLNVSQLDLGGGYPVKYMERADYSEALEGGRFWQDRRIGDHYPYASNPSGPDHAVAVIEGLLKQDSALTLLAANETAIVLQPGRALVDQCGFTLFRVIGSKSSSSGIRIVTLDGLSFSLSETWFDSDFLPEPQLIKKRGSSSASKAAELALAGRSCLERDMIRWRTVRFSAEIESGDLLLIPNTAGYQMDSNESPFHRLPLPQKVAATLQGSQWHFAVDDKATIRNGAGL